MSDKKYSTKFALEYYRADYLAMKEKANRSMRDECFIALYDAAFNNADTSR